MISTRNTLCKEERLHGRDAVESLFKKAGSRSMVAFPLRVVYALTDHKRNRVKRQVREAYRCNKHSLAAAVTAMEGNKDLSLAFVWLDDKLHPSAEVEKRVQRLLQRLEEKL